MQLQHNNYIANSAHNVHSFDGEDGILEKILSLIPQSELTQWCVEFGAWDGHHLSNTRYHIEQKQYSAILIEGSAVKHKVLAANYAHNTNVYPINAYVGYNAADNLDHILATTPIPLEYDYVSIDIDGNDYHVWEHCTKYTPKVVCIEYNPTIPNEVSYIQPKDFALQKGNSLLALYNLGISKGYYMVAVSKWNAFFVLENYKHLYSIAINHPVVMNLNNPYITHFYYGFDGEVMLSGNTNFTWHNVAIKAKHLQVLPRPFRVFPYSMGKWKWKVFRVYAKLKGLI